MTDFRRFPGGSSRQLIDYNRFVSLTGEKVFICLDRGVMEAARYLLNSRGSWRTTWVKEYVGTIGYNMPTEAEFEIVENAIAEANEDMSSCDDLVNAIQGVTAAITSTAGSSGSGCGCVGDGGTDVTEVNDIPSQPIPPSTDWEELGYSSQEDYETKKCNRAQWIIENYIGTLNNWAGLSGTVGGLTLAVITALCLLTVPPVGLMVILGALGVLVGIDIGLLATLSMIAGGIQEQEDDLRCELYNAETTGEAIDAIKAVTDSVIDGLDLGVLAITFTTICDNLVSNETVATLFDPAAPGVSADCSDCGGGVVNYEVILSGTETSTNPSNPILINFGEYPSGPVLGCGSNAKAFYVTFDQDVSITGTYIFEGEDPFDILQCGEEPIFHYWSGPDFTGVVNEGNDPPQESPSGACRTFGMVINCDGATLRVEVHYTPL